MKFHITYTTDNKELLSSKALLAEKISEEASSRAKKKAEAVRRRNQTTKSSPKKSKVNSSRPLPQFGTSKESRVLTPWQKNQRIKVEKQRVKNLTKSFHKELETQFKKVERIGIWDMTGMIGLLPRLLEKLNKVQTQFVFFALEAPIPSDLVSRENKVREWLKRENLPAKTASKIVDNLIAEDFYKFSKPIRKRLELHAIVGIVPTRIADVVDGEAWWNLFYSWNENHIVVSIADLFEFAERASKPSETAVMSMITAGLLQERVSKELVHADRGCIFDLNEERTTLVRTLQHLEIDAICCAELGGKYSKAGKEILKVLNKEKRKSK